MTPGRSIRVLACVAAVLISGACTGLLVGEGDPRSPAELFDAIWGDFDRYYASFELKGVDWNDVYARYRPEADLATAQSQLIGTIRRMFAELRDRHVDLSDAEATLAQSVDRSAIDTGFDFNVVVRNYLPGWKRTSGRRIFYGTIASGVGYVWIHSFAFSGWSDDIDEALAFFGSPAAVIIDVRDNGGGSTDNAEAIAARLVGARQRFAYVKYRNGPRHDDFTPLIAVDVTPKGARAFAGPVIVLTNRKSVSATEYFILAMRMRSSTTFVGDTSGGAFSTPLLRELPNGWSFRVPQSVVYDVSGATHEGIGLAPSLLVPQDTTMGRDSQLEAAIALAMAGPVGAPVR